MELARFGPWKAANFKVALFIVICVALSIAPYRDRWFGIDSESLFLYVIAPMIALVLIHISKAYEISIDRFVPSSSLEAKRANEQIKLMAAFANTIAAACVSVMALTELLKETPQYSYIAAAFCVSAIVHGGARRMVGLLKDENVDGAE